MNTVNVVEVPNSDEMAISKLLSFEDDRDGNTEAEIEFRKLIKESNKDITDSEIDDAIEEGYFENYPYYIALVHSTNE